MNYNEEKFKLATNIKKFILESEKLVQNIPRSDYYNRDKIKNDITTILYLVYLANNIQEKEIRKKYQIEICARISMIDFYLERAYLYKYISEKQLYNFSRQLETILKMVKGWMKSEECQTN